MGIQPCECSHFEIDEAVEHSCPTAVYKMEKEIEERVLNPRETNFRDQIATWLQKYPWSWLWTVTYDRMEKRVKQNYTRTGYPKGKPEPVGVSEMCAKKIFKRYMKKNLPAYSWFYVCEANKHRAGVHIHALLIPGAGQHVNIARHGPKWWDAYGWNELEPIKNKSDVTAYCTKHVAHYLTKGVGWYDIEINDSEVFHSANAI